MMLSPIDAIKSFFCNVSSFITRLFWMTILLDRVFDRCLIIQKWAFIIGKIRSELPFMRNWKIFIRLYIGVSAKALITFFNSKFFIMVINLFFSP